MKSNDSPLKSLFRVLCAVHNNLLLYRRRHRSIVELASARLDWCDECDSTDWIHAVRTMAKICSFVMCRRLWESFFVREMCLLSFAAHRSRTTRLACLLFNFSDAIHCDLCWHIFCDFLSQNWPLEFTVYACLLGKHLKLSSRFLWPFLRSKLTIIFGCVFIQLSHIHGFAWLRLFAFHLISIAF